MKGHLVEINDADENAFIKAEAKLRKRKLLRTRQRTDMTFYLIRSIDSRMLLKTLKKV
jgi:hypothetical protein